ncbi:putative serine/threonine-protein kinase-like protein, partial [Leptotrombidium deliense]
MPKKKKSAAKASVASNAKTTRVADTTESSETAINEKIIRLFACRMGTSLAKNVTENGEKSHESSGEETRCEDDDENKDNLQKMDSFFEKNAFSIECDEKHKESIKCLLQSKVNLSAKRCLKECVCDICDCEDCKKKNLERKMKEAEKNATSLIAEEERKKKKLEKKKSQKKKRKQQKKVDDERSKSDEQNEIVNKQLGTLLNKELHINEKKNEAIDKGSITQKNKKIKNEKIKMKVVEKPSTPSVPSSSDEEELNLNSAFVADIAQRKSKASATSTSAIANKSPFVDTQYTLDFDDSDDTVDETDSQDSFSSKSGLTASQSNSYQKHNEHKNNGYVDQSINIETAFGSKCEEGVKKSVDIGAQANKEALNKNFALAVEMFKKAIELNPSDYRFYVNRSYCYDCLFDYENALKDAETAISLNHVWPKCYYRKGRALSGLRRFE